MNMQLDQVDTTRIRQIIDGHLTSTSAMPAIDHCVQAIIDYAGTDPRIRAGTRALVDGTTDSPEVMVARILADIGAYDAAEFDAWAGDGPPPGACVEPFSEPDPVVDTAVVPRALIDAACRELTACTNILRAVLGGKTLTPPELTNIRQHKKSCRALSEQLQAVASPAWPFAQQSNTTE